MKRFALILSVAAALSTLVPPCGAQDSKTRKEERKEAKANAVEAKKMAKTISECDFTREFKALEEGAELLAEVSDQKSAQKAAKKLCAMFNALPVPMGGTDEQLEVWATKANKLNRQLERLRKEKWFVASGLQEAWTLATDPFSRRRAAKK